jgi:hypothetical protein
MNVEIKSFKEIFPSLLSIVKDIPSSVLVSFSMTDATLKSRNKYLESTINRLNNITKFTARYLKAHPTELPFFDIVLELSNWIDKEQRVRLAIRRLVNHWFYKKYSKRCLNENDPWTLCPPTNPIILFDSKCRGYYQFEANSLKLHIEKSLEYSQWLFPTPYAPKNPLTNLPFHDGQLNIILSGLRAQGYGSWKIEAYKASNWNLKQFQTDNAIQLRLHAINQLVKYPNDELYELLEEFIEDQYKENDLSKKKTLVIIKWAVRSMLDNDYMQKWLKLFHDYHKLKYRYNIQSAEDLVLQSIYVRSMQLFYDHDSISILANKRLKELRKRTIVNVPIIQRVSQEEYQELLDMVEVQTVMNTIVGQIVDQSFTETERFSSVENMEEQEVSYTRARVGQE